MILADTSIWVDYLGRGDDEVAALLHHNRILIHRYVIGEIALGSLSDRRLVLGELNDVPHIMEATHSNVMTLIEVGPVYSTGIGYVDAHLLAALKITPQHKLWTRDKRLARTAALIGVELYA